MTVKDILKACIQVVAMLLLCIGLLIRTALAQSPMNSVLSFEISPQPLPSALTRYSEQSGVQVTSSSRLVEQKKSQGVIGQLPAREALAKLLEGTTLSFEVIDAGSVVIVPVRATLSPRPGEKRPVSDTGNETAQEEQEVVVTGSHIRRNVIDHALTLSFDRMDFSNAGSTSTQEFLRALPQNFAGGRSEASAAVMSFRNGGRDNLTHGAGVNLRGLGNEATLVLINGRRMAAGGSGGFYDLSTIPLSAIERIDIVPDGASAIYGSDALAGVVNIILRDNIDGAETSLRYGTVTSGDLSDWSVNQLFGKTWERGSIVLNADYGERDSLAASDRPFARGLWGGRNDLLPDEERLSALARAHYRILDSLSASVDIYANRRDSHVQHFQSFTQNQLSSDSESESIAGTFELAWSLAKDWKVELAHTYSDSDNVRSNHLGNVQPPHNTVNLELAVSATEIKAAGMAFEAPGGMSQVALGVERREESLDLRRVDISGAPDTSNGLSRSVDAAFVELHVPLMTRESRNRLDVTAAVRYEDYSDVGDTDTVKVGATWAPLPSISLHTTWGTSFRAPYLQQFDTTFGTGILLNAPNPASPTGTTFLAIATQAPHPDLGPEHATTWTTGFSIRPDMLPRTRITATYFHIDYKDRIVTPGVTSMPFSDPAQVPLISVPADPEVLEFVRIAPVGSSRSGQDFGRVQGTLDARTRNQSRAKVSGLDLVLSHELQTDAGVVKSNIDATYLHSFDTWVNRSSPRVSILDTVFNPVALRARGQLTWSRPEWSISASINYVDSYRDNQTTSSRRVASWSTIDASTAYVFRSTTGLLRGLTLKGSVLNAMDKAPPRIVDRRGAFGDPGYDTENASALGRFVALQVIKDW
ncbi:TonB-dependent receptor [Peristeroidobacter soli]|uniref:TonB-dependent receptor n=1 Tax=Peristeroidobacter soli TaxID=2497877 RepID=UPI00101CC9F7|nr:TonB-dependent receptor [Peristeroidobacter soli]